MTVAAHCLIHLIVQTFGAQLAQLMVKAQRQAAGGSGGEAGQVGGLFEREVGELRFVFNERSQEALTTVMRWKSAQYAELGEWDRFADPDNVALLRHLSARDAERVVGGGGWRGGRRLRARGGRRRATAPKAARTRSWWPAPRRSP